MGGAVEVCECTVQWLQHKARSDTTLGSDARGCRQTWLGVISTVLERRGQDSATVAIKAVGQAVRTDRSTPAAAATSFI